VLLHRIVSSFFGKPALPFLSFTLVRLLFKELQLSNFDDARSIYYSESKLLRAAPLQQARGTRDLIVYIFFILNYFVFIYALLFRVSHCRFIAGHKKVMNILIFLIFFIWFNTLVLCRLFNSLFIFFFPISVRLISRSDQLAAIMSDPTTAEEAAAKAALDSTQSNFFLSSKLIFLLAVMVPVVLLGNPHLDKTYCAI